MKIKFVSILILTFFLGSGIFSFTHALEMAKNGHHMGDCPITMVQEVVCNLNPIAHLTNWQIANTFDPNTSHFLLLLLGITVVFYVYEFFKNRYSPPKPSVLRFAHANLPVYLYTNIYSRGILNPKIY